jgi:hypothetical protein
VLGLFIFLIIVAVSLLRPSKKPALSSCRFSYFIGTGFSVSKVVEIDSNLSFGFPYSEPKELLYS